MRPPTALAVLSLAAMAIAAPLPAPGSCDNGLTVRPGAHERCPEGWELSRRERNVCVETPQHRQHHNNKDQGRGGGNGRGKNNNKAEREREREREQDRKQRERERERERKERERKERERKGRPHHENGGGDRDRDGGNNNPDRNDRDRDGNGRNDRNEPDRNGGNRGQDRNDNNGGGRDRQDETECSFGERLQNGRCVPSNRGGVKLGHGPGDEEDRHADDGEDGCPRGQRKGTGELLNVCVDIRLGGGNNGRKPSNRETEARLENGNHRDPHLQGSSCSDSDALLGLCIKIGGSPNDGANERVSVNNREGNRNNNGNGKNRLGNGIKIGKQQQGDDCTDANALLGLCVKVDLSGKGPLLDADVKLGANGGRPAATAQSDRDAARREGQRGREEAQREGQRGQQGAERVGNNAQAAAPLLDINAGIKLGGAAPQAGVNRDNSRGGARVNAANDRTTQPIAEADVPAVVDVKVGEEPAAQRAANNVDRQSNNNNNNRRPFATTQTAPVRAGADADLKKNKDCPQHQRLVAGVCVDANIAGIKADAKVNV